MVFTVRPTTQLLALPNHARQVSSWAKAIIYPVKLLVVLPNAVRVVHRQQQSLTNLLFERQFAPCSKRACSRILSEQSTRCIESWAEDDSLKRCSATYCQLTPPPRSTIAAAFSPDGKLVASTQYVITILRTNKPAVGPNVSYAC